MGARITLRAAACALFSLLAVPALTSAFETARMVMPDEFAADAERIAITGFGGRNRGQYRLGSYAGSFERIETRWAIFDPLYAASRARGAFMLSGPGIDGTVSALGPSCWRGRGRRRTHRDAFRSRYRRHPPRVAGRLPARDRRCGYRRG